MLHVDKYDLYIFDCDGVILDSNKLKIQAMRESLNMQTYSLQMVEKCLEYFSNNFGKSRFHHVKYFVDEILKIKDIEKIIENEILKNFSEKCEKMYLNAPLTPGFLSFIETINGKKFVASGSEQSELQKVFKERGLNKYFVDIYGSPTPKNQLVNKILSDNSHESALMIGDAISDFEASQVNGIDFACYIPYSNVKSKMERFSSEYKFTIIEDWQKLK